MPPKKEKKEQFKGDEATDMILEYLVKQNHVSSNMHNAITKVTATKLLKEMHDSGQVEGRISGKQIVYHAIQDPNEGVSEEELKAMDQKIEAIREETAALKARAKERQALLASLRATPDDAALNASADQLQEEIKELQQALETLEAGEGQPVDAAEKAAADAYYRRIEREHSKRRKQFREFWAVLCDMTESDPGELWESLGLDGEPL